MKFLLGLLFMSIVFLTLLASCSSALPAATDPTSTPPPTPIPRDVYYVDGELGSDSNPGTKSQPWQSIDKAVNTVAAGDLLYVRGGEYKTIFAGWDFQNSGTKTQPITISNYPGEQVVINISQSSLDYRAFRCWAAPTDPASWQTPKADYIRITGTDVSARVLSNGVTSQKGIVVQGVKGEQGMGIEAAGCDNWEVSGLDFVDVAYGIFTKKRNFRTTQDYSPDNWYVHNNRVYSFYRESGMQFNGNYNLIENNEIYKVSNELNTPYGCQLLNLDGNNNIVKRNTLSRLGSTANCGGILLEWDLADANIIEQNTISDVPWILSIAGGDNNIFRNNILYPNDKNWLEVYNYDNYSGWPCNEETDSQADIPANDPSAPDYKYYYPHDCHSEGNQVYDNIVR
ncbi:MAG: right-handed parallel beta-helix repeat-containing protein [Chloroflexi bacterium]|nr:right-handed parallel beta-helix repeat-containing protein [Chloroflexota bacterium]MBI1856602.1 right-handed parallel beta-helix repeat-containing protein [Chloroflexota bacterium]